jgi:PBP1b-binding outer membrane lipoprotein LpoB
MRKVYPMIAIKNASVFRAALAVSSLLVGVVLLGGCESKPTWKETDERQSITTGGLDIQNFNNAAERLTQKMLTAPRVSKELASIEAETRTLPLIKITRIKNDTGIKINLIDYLVTPIEEVLVNSGKTDFFSEDRTGQDLAYANELLKKHGAKANLPDFVLHGTVSKLGSSGDGVDQRAYVFQLRLTNTRTNTVVFVGNEQIIKQGR